MPFNEQVYDSFRILYESYWKTEFQETHDQISQHVDTHMVPGKRLQIPRIKKGNDATEILERDNPGRAAADRRRLGDTDLGTTEIVNLYTKYYAATDYEIERTELERLGTTSSPEQAFKVNQKAEIIRKMNRVLVNGILADRQLGELATEADAIPAGQVIDTTGSGGFTYANFDDLYTELGTRQVLGQGLNGDNHAVGIIRHKDLQVFRNDDTLKNYDFSDTRPIDNGRIQSFREFSFIVLPDDAFADTVDAGTVKLPFFVRSCVAWGRTGKTWAQAKVHDDTKGGMILELEEAFGCTSLDWTGVQVLQVPQTY